MTSVSLAALALAALLVPSAANGGTTVGRIVEPSADAPIHVVAGDHIYAVTRLRLPLTPPPGVQQPEAWEGWSIRISRRLEIAIDSAQPVLEYPARLVRIRPVGGDRYRISASLLPWLPPGRYDLAIEGPGFAGITAESVIVAASDHPPARSGRIWRKHNDGSVELVAAAAHIHDSTLEVVAPANGAGVSAVAVSSVTGDRQLLPLVNAVWATVPTADRPGAARLLRFRVGGSAGAATNGAEGLEVELADVDRERCRPKIRWLNGSGRRDFTTWHELEFSGITDPIAVIWDFGDGMFGVGRRVRHRWLFDSRARITATSFDRTGVPCSASASVSSIRPSNRGCTCANIGWRFRSSSEARPGLLGFFLSAALGRE